MLSAMMVVYGFVSGGPGARALQLTTPSFHSLHNDSSVRAGPYDRAAAAALQTWALFS